MPNSAYFAIGISPAPFVADEDLTAKQWMLVAAASTAGYVKAANSACDPTPIGVLVNDPSTGQAAAVVLFGPTKAKVRSNACTLRHGGFLRAASDGFFEPIATTGSTIWQAGRWFGAVETGAATCLLGNVFVHIIAPDNAAS